jgi:conjugal transfer pilus assembly protein TraE
MDIRLDQYRRQDLKTQRTALLGLSATLLLIVVLQAYFLCFRHERTIILPPELKQSFWVEGNTFSPLYLEEQALYMAHLLLDVSESNILMQGEVLLRYVVPENHEAFKTKILNDEQRLKRESLSLLFAPHTCEVNVDTLTVDITGDLHGYVGGKRVNTQRETYRLAFESKKGRLFIKQCDVIETDHKEEDTQ